MTDGVSVDATEQVEQGGSTYSTVVFAIFALLGLLVAYNGVTLGIGSASNPDAGLWPLIVGLMWATAAVFAAVSAWRGKDRLEPLTRLSEPLKALGLTVLFILTFSYIGFVVSVITTLVLWIRLLTDIAWPRMLIVTAVVTAILYLIFVVIVGTAFPASLVGLR